MDVIILGFYNQNDSVLAEKLAIKNNLKIIWDYQQYKIESEIGISDLHKYFKLSKIGILIDANFKDGEIFYSYPLINEISDFYIQTEWENKPWNIPRIYNFFDDLNNEKINRMIVSFADEWNEKTTVKIENIDFVEVKSRLYSAFVWCNGNRNLRTNSEIRDDAHPLVLELLRTKKCENS